MIRKFFYFVSWLRTMIKIRDNGFPLPCCTTLAASKPTKELQAIPRPHCKKDGKDGKGLYDIERFERLNNYQFNVFC